QTLSLCSCFPMRFVTDRRVLVGARTPSASRLFTVMGSRKQDTTIAEVHEQTQHISEHTQLARVNITTIVDRELNDTCEIITTFDLYSSNGVPEFRITKRVLPKR